MATRNLKKQLSLRGDKVIWIIVLLMALISIVAVYSSSYALAYRGGVSTFHILIGQMRSILISWAVLFVFYKAPLSLYRKWALPALGVIGLMLAVVLIQYYLLGTTKHLKAARWFDFGFGTIQPAEFAKIAVIIYLAKILEVKKFNDFKTFICWILIPVGGIAGMTLMGSFSATVIICLTCFVILVCSDIPRKYIYRTLGLVALAGSVAFGCNLAFGWFERLDTVTNRVERFFMSEEERQMLSLEEQQKIADKEYQSKEAEQAIQLGGLKGLGPGNSIKRNTLPNPYDDYIYSIIVEEWGLIVGSLVLFLYIWFLFRCVIIAQACKKPFAALSVIGLGCLITFQALIHIAVNIGAIPETGQTLPMISHGGTAYILMSAALGIILSINRTIEISKENEEKAKKALLWNNTETPEKSS